MAPVDDLRAALTPALTPQSRELFERLLARAAVTRDDCEWVCVFPPFETPGEAPGEVIDRTWRVAVMPARRIPDNVPAPLARLLAVSSGMVCGEPGNTGQLVLHAGDEGTLHVVGEDAWSEGAAGYPYADELCAPIDVDLQGFYVVDPRDGHLHYHDSEGTLEPAPTDDPVEAYLRELAARVRV